MLIRSHQSPPLPKFAFFQIIEDKILSQGFNSLVYEGVNVLTGDHVCIKRIMLLNELQQKLAYNELFCLKDVSHPNVLQYLYDFRTTSEIYIVTELCQETLFTRLREQGKISQTEAIATFSQILSGYEQIRAKGYLHRDLKPQNIFYKKGQIKIADFGFCSKTKLPQLKQEYNVGTPFYMAPQAIQHNIYSQKSDIWSLGVILYQLIHGKVPFTSKTEKDLIKQLKFLTIRYECHPQLQKIIRNMLNPNRSKRFNLRDLQSALSKYLQMENKHRYTQIQTKIFNQIKYANFLQYVQLISSKIRKNNKRSRINFLLQYTLRMRFGLIETLEQSSPVIQIKLKKQVQDLKSKHQSAFKIPQTLSQTDKLKFLNIQKPAFNYFTLWHIQAELKDTLKQFLRDLSNIDSEQKVARNEEQIKLADFLLTAYVINRMLIDSENCMQQFSEKLQLDLILNRPHRLNLNVYRAIKQKAQELCII